MMALYEKSEDHNLLATHFTVVYILVKSKNVKLMEALEQWLWYS